MRIAVVQHDIVWEDKDANFARLAPQIEQAAATGADLVVLTEMFSTGFSMRTDVIAEPAGGPSSQFLVDRAAAHGVWVCGSCPEVHDGSERPHNTLVLAGPDGTVHRYRKLHRFAYGGEDRSFAAGDERGTADAGGLRGGPVLCYQQGFPDQRGGLAPRTGRHGRGANRPRNRRPPR